MSVDDLTFTLTFDHLSKHLPGLAPAVLTELSLLTADHIIDRVGAALSEGMSDRHLEEFDAISGDHDDATAWLEQMRPGYQELTPQVVDAELEKTVRAVLSNDPEAGRPLDTTALPLPDWDSIVNTLNGRYSTEDTNDHRVILALQHPGRRPLHLGVAAREWWLEVFCSFGNVSDAHLTAACRTALTAGRAGIVAFEDSMIIRFAQPRVGLTVHGLDAAISEVFTTARAAIDALQATPADSRSDN